MAGGYVHRIFGGLWRYLYPLDDSVGGRLSCFCVRDLANIDAASAYAHDRTNIDAAACYANADTYCCNTYGHADGSRCAHGNAIADPDAVPFSYANA